MNETNESAPSPPVSSVDATIENSSTIPQTPVVTERKKRATTEKQLAALKAGREKRWKLMFEALEKERNDRVNAEATTETRKADAPPPPSDGLLEVESSEESESEDDFAFGKSIENTASISNQRQRKYKLSKVVRNRIDKYVEKKLYESVYTQPQLQQLNKNVYEEQQQAYDYSRAYPYVYTTPTCHN